MTYRTLLEKLQKLPDERLDDLVTLYLSEHDEYITASGCNIANDDNDVLDDGHFYINVDI